ncbi:MAG TPA: ribonuclease PH [Phycisphaerae bacterium]|nr:ribonuclease PH [Phycisphaerae bacterium]
MPTQKRHDDRTPSQTRPLKIQRKFTNHAGGSVLISFGQTRVLCTAMIEKDLPPWLKAKGPNAGGWLTAEYSMLPSSTTTRKRRDTTKPDGRSVEIQRLIGRALRSVLNLKALQNAEGHGLTLFVDCDVLQADGGTRTAAITGAWIAIADAISAAQKSNLLPRPPVSRRRSGDVSSFDPTPYAGILTNQVAAISVGIVDGTPVADLDYEEDVEAHVDMNVAMLADGTFVEVQGTGEHATFSTKQLHQMLNLATTAISQLHTAQRAALKRK